jgi:4-methyl-5(b-hydroxyethyl)-thiazole monophosphate biosynthesis
MKAVLLLLCNGVEIYEAAAFYDVLGWSGSYGSEPVKVVTAGFTSPVRCTFGLHVIPDVLASAVDASAFHALAIPGGFETFGFYDDAYSEAAANLIRDFDAQSKPISSICVGALPVASSGVIAGRNATTYHLGDGRRRLQLAEFGVNVIDAPLVRDLNVTTSTSPATAIDVALQLLADLTGDDNAARIRRRMGF